MEINFIEYRDTIIVNNCCCLHPYGVKDDLCIKRNIEIKDPFIKSYHKILVCNEFLKLTIQQKNNYKKFYEVYNYKYALENILETILMKFYRFKYPNLNLRINSRFGYVNDLFDKEIRIIVHERPCLFFSITLSEAINFIIEENIHLGYIENSKLLSEVLSLLLNFYENKKEVKKHIKICELISKIKRNRVWNEEAKNDNLLNLLIEIINTTEYNLEQNKKK